MKAAVFHEHGPLDNLRYEDIPDPKPGPAEALLRVRAVALNGFDPMVLRGIPGLKTPLPMIPGADIAGEIIELGAEVDRGRWKIGDRVMVIPNHPDGMMGETKRGGRRTSSPSTRSTCWRCPRRSPSPMRPPCPSPMARRCA